MSQMLSNFRVTGARSTDIEIAGEEYKGKNYVEIMKETDWTNKRVQERFQEVMLDKSVRSMQYCPAASNLIVVKIFLPS